MCNSLLKFRHEQFRIEQNGVLQQWKAPPGCSISPNVENGVVWRTPETYDVKNGAWGMENWDTSTSKNYGYLCKPKTFTKKLTTMSLML